MPRLFQKMWYSEKDEPRFFRAVRKAFLYNCRDNDLAEGGRIEQGQVVRGACGIHAAEAAIEGLSARPESFRPNRQCEWGGFTLNCMALEGLPQGKVPRNACRHRHCVVAEFSDPAAAEAAREAGLPLVRSAEGVLLGNLEIASIPGQGRERRAVLL